MAITQMDVLKDMLECMEVEDHVIREISKMVILNLGEREAEIRGAEHKTRIKNAQELEEEAKAAFRNGDMSKLSKKEQRKLKKKIAAKKALEEEEETEEEETVKPKAAKGSHLIPKEKVEYPKELLKHKDLGKLLRAHEQGGEEGRKARKALRKIGFKLSDSTTWKPFLKK